MSAQLSSPAVPGDGERASKPDGEAVAVTLAGSEISGASEAHAPAPASTNGQTPAPNRRSITLLSRTSISHVVKDRDKDGTKSLTKTLSGGTTPAANVGMDTLSTQIYLRTTNSGGPEPPSITHRLRNSARSESPTVENGNANEMANKPPSVVIDAPRDRRKGPSFLSRLGMRGSWKRDGSAVDSDSEMGDVRTDGSSAQAMTSIIGAGGGYIPLYKEPPRYIRVKPHNKKGREFNRLFLAQELQGSRQSAGDGSGGGRAPATAVGSKILKPGDAIWAAEFSVDGRYLAVAGKDQTVRVFSVISTAEDRRAHEEEEEARNKGNGEKLSAPVFLTKPTAEFEGHTGEVLALSWSKNNFLLSSSMDKTVKLWHLSRRDCLCTFRHNDLVTSIAFHPTDDRFFLAGSLDAQLRLWSIPDKAVAFSAQTHEFITAVAFSPDGKTAICGMLSGLCLFHETEGLKQLFQIHVRSSRGRNAKGSKITGIRTAVAPAESQHGDVKVLISSNDSRVRIYSLRTRMLEVKFKGLENQSSQIHARFSDDGLYVISGSEDRRAYIWGAGQPEAEMKDKQPYECFDAHPEVVTTALMAPVKSRQLLSASGDPIYDLCNPPPITLRSLEERTASGTRLPDGGGGGGEAPASAKKPEETPAYIERSKHMDGNIIITTDRTGTIKVFRQDCAFAKRLQNTWETGSKFSGKLTGVGRSASIMTRTSAGSRAHSRRGSLNLGTGSGPVQPASDRIMSWRQEIEGRASTSGMTTRSERSMSPMRASRSPLGTSAGRLAAEARRQPFGSSPVLRPHKPTSPASSFETSKPSLRLVKDGEGSSLPPTPSFSLVSASDSDPHTDRGPEGSFWNRGRWKGGLQGLPGLRYTTSAISSASLSGSAPAASHIRAGSDSLAPGSARTAVRRSLGIRETAETGLGEDEDRRRSTGTALANARPALGRPGPLGGGIGKGAERVGTRTNSGTAQAGTK
ncbi:hypothetical protein RJ55_07540 [Drechmeria coniospora]|nr:hypothetical protein RJ55_07540 [Drechmeria coniospora]